MVREEITVWNPAVDMFLLPTHKKLPGHLSIPEREQLLEALAKDPISLGFCDYTLVATGLLTGLRCSELSHLQLGHQNLEAGTGVDGKGAPRAANRARSWLCRRSRTRNACGWAGSREEAERLRAATPVVDRLQSEGG